jgi:hypothetical protein
VRRATGITSFLLLAVAAIAGAPKPASAQFQSCTQEAAAIRRAQNELPRIEVAPPDDKQIVCITLETNILFARRLAAHIAQCPRSPLAGQAGAWERTGAQYSARFRERRCKPAIGGNRG